MGPQACWVEADSRGLTRASPLEVSAEDRGVVLDGAAIKLWVGLLGGDSPDEGFGQDSHGVACSVAGQGGARAAWIFLSPSLPPRWVGPPQKLRISTDC